MSPEPFLRLSDQFPKWKQVWSILRKWARKHPTVRFIEAARLGEILSKDIDRNDADEVIRIIFDSNLFIPMLAIESPTGRQVYGPWKSPEEIPEHIEGEFGRFFDAEEGEVVPVLVEAHGNVY